VLIAGLKWTLTKQPVVVGTEEPKRLGKGTESQTSLNMKCNDGLQRDRKGG